ncbi:hypothetical protein ACFLU4_05865 [Chloroflexota bacterium]
MKRILYGVLTVLLIVVVGGCRSAPGDGEVIIRPAPIHEVRVNIAESFPPQVFVYIKGGLADGCTTFHELKHSKSDGHNVVIEVTVQRPQGVACAQVYGFFERNINLGSDFTSGETYTIRVNDKTATFIMQ